MDSASAYAKHSSDRQLRTMIGSIILFLAITALPFAGTAAGDTLAERANDLYRALSQLDDIETMGRSERAERVQRAYDLAFANEFTGDALGSRSDDDLHLLFDVASTVSFENPDGMVYKDALSALQRLGDKANGHEVRSAQGMLFQARRVRELDAFNNAQANAGTRLPTPAIKGYARHHSVLVVTDAFLPVKAVDIARGPRVVVVAHPLCHFTQAAMHAIGGNPRLKELMRKNTVWIAPPDRNMDFTAFSDWNDKHPEAPISIAYSYSTWPELDEWGTPTFYFFKDGALIDTVVGWPRGGRMGALQAGLAKIGLATD